MAGLTNAQANSYDIIKAPVALLEFGHWVTAGGAATFYNGGWLRDVKFSVERAMKEVEADNCSWPLDAYYTSTKARLTGAFLEANLQRIGIALGLDHDDTIYTAGTSHTLPLDEAPAANEYWQVRLSILDQAMIPKRLDTWSSINFTAIKRTITLWRCMFVAKLDFPIKKADEMFFPFEIVPFFDTSVTPSTTTGRIGKIVDTPS